MSDNLIVLNANIGRTNVMEFEEFSEAAIKTADEIVDHILPLCGSHALQNLVVYRHLADEFMKNVFSNDGIHILKSIEYLSPIQTYIANYLRYIGQRVEKAAADGTSTAIVMGASLISMVLTDLRDMRNAINTDLEYDATDKQRAIMIETDAIANHVSEVLKSVLEAAEILHIDVHTVDRETKRALIYQLAHTTSKGDETLTNFAVDLFIDLPELLYEQTGYRQSHSETDENFIIENPEADFVINVLPSNNTQYNRKLNTEVEYDDCDILIIPVLYNRLNHITQWLEKRKLDETQNKRNLVIVYSGGNDNEILKLDLSVDHSLVTICKHTVYTDPVFVDNPIELHVVQVVAGFDQIVHNSVEDIEKSLIRGVHCRLADKCLYMHDLFSHDTAPLHPSYVNGEHASYNKLRAEIEAHIKELSTSHGQKNYTAQIDGFTRIYRNMICSKLPVLTIGGSTVDHLANINVVNDVLGVVSVAMKHGVILDFIPKLVYRLLNLIQLDNRPWLMAFFLGMERYCRLTYERDDVWPMLRECNNSFLEFRELMFTDGKWSKLDADSRDKVVVVQSYRAVSETISRLIETIPRFMRTDRIIVQNGVTENTKEK